MLKQGSTKSALCAGMLATALVSLCLASSASAQLTGDFTVFEQCPTTNPEVNRCFYAGIQGGEFSVGERDVPIVNPIALQGAFTKPVAGLSSFIAAVNGETLTPAAQPVPGGLFGIVPPEDSPPAVKGLVKALLASHLNRVNARVELASPPSSIQISLAGMLVGAGPAAILPIKVHLENPLFGKNCYVGSNDAPIALALTAGATAPPPPNTSIAGNKGKIEVLADGRILRLSGVRLVDNAWAAPKATGCGGNLRALINPIVNAQLGLPSAAGHNSAILEGTQLLSPPAAVQSNDEENP